MKGRTICSAALLALALCGAGASPAAAETTESAATSPVSWSMAEGVDVAAINSDLVAGRPTVDIGIYIPSNFDEGFEKVTLPSMMEAFQAAKEIYAPTGVQLNLLFVKTGEIDERFLAIQSNEIPRIPDTEYVNSYVASKRHPSEMTNMAKAAFESIVEPDVANSRTVYLVALQDVIFPFLEVAEGRNWTVKMVRTGGLSFPTYSYHDTLPERLRGIISITNLSTPSRKRRTIAHEIGHKVMNVSHEYKTTNPAHEIYAEGGLMLYGAGEDIPSGEEGRWHLERLLMSPFVYRLDEQGRKQWNPDYKEGGHYYDPLYGEKVVHFPGVSEMDPDW
ncbi:ImmA/IrrE family metallo-endopeptidase [Croceicoccus sp. Ery15]|uniref:ImmA/IrrE family metallo-endopeptidase n=1 Tax=Croceicoccus sp. Ery15 TaxID=1703338 RepID=UPI001E56626D|nr:ImmA/IrrE family metallo-endopeptidase [Croceicoccus sp. Ery15]